MSVVHESDGWIKLHRKMLDNPVVMKDASHLAVWVYLLMNATHKEYPVFFGGRKTVLKPGELITGCVPMSKILDISESKVRRILESFKNDGQIDERVTNEGRLISILSWDKYQITDGQSDGRVTDDRRTSDGRVTDLLYKKNVRMEEYNNNNIYISTDEKNSDSEILTQNDSGILEKAPEAPKPTMSPNEARRATYEKAIREAIRNNDRSAIDRVSNIAHVMGCDIDVKKIYEEERHKNENH